VKKGLEKRPDRIGKIIIIIIIIIIISSSSSPFSTMQFSGCLLTWMLHSTDVNYKASTQTQIQHKAQHWTDRTKTMWQGKSNINETLGQKP
jgi:hypothetical protein